MLTLALLSLLFAQEPETTLRPERAWAGTLPEDALRANAPPSKLITDAAAFEKLWTAWRPGEETPEIDFAKSVIVVGTIDGPNRMFVSLNREGTNVKTQFGGTKIGGPGFGYILASVKREGVTSIDGQPLGETETQPEPAEEPGIEPRPDRPVPPDQSDRPVRESIRVTVRGTLETGIVAIGGETTGTVIRSKGMTFEVQLDPPHLRERAEALNGQAAVVAGELVVKEGVETGQRWIIEATRIDLVRTPRASKRNPEPPSEP